MAIVTATRYGRSAIAQPLAGVAVTVVVGVAVKAGVAVRVGVGDAVAVAFLVDVGATI